MTTTAAAIAWPAHASAPEASLTHLERCLLRLGRVQVDAAAASTGREAVARLAARGLMVASHRAGGAVIVGEITEAGRCALAWAEDRPAAGLN